MAAPEKKDAFTESKRELTSLTAGVEKRALVAMASRLPAWVGPDHLTALGLAAMAGAGVAYALSDRDLRWLHVVNLCLVVNWFGDSLDGTVARVRQTLRPRYGFYVDHMVDAFGALFLLAGLAASRLMSLEAAGALLIVYYLMHINIYLATYTRGTFKLSYGLVGGTELRILLAGANLAVMRWPAVSVMGQERLLFDLIAAGATVALAVVTLRSTAQNTKYLYDLERLP